MQFKSYLVSSPAAFFLVHKDNHGISSISAVHPDADWIPKKGFQDNFLKKFSGYALLCERNQPQTGERSDVFFTRTGELIEAPFIRNKEKIIAQLMSEDVTSAVFSNTSQECKLTRPLVQEEADFVFEQMMKDLFKSSRLFAEEDIQYALNLVLEDSREGLSEEVYLVLKSIERY